MSTDRLARARALAAAVQDPELPALSIGDLGLLRRVEERDGAIAVTLTPSYTGCPAMAVIGWEVTAALERAGLGPVLVQTELAPAWSSDAISAAGRARLREAGIAPPGERVCPRCGGTRVETLAEFGATACKALWRCQECREPFESFKTL
ncbi:MAG: 1,2-phenylacetyl-CoA epoxidase subunit PaaD [Acetobacteraceae bacterium]